MNRLVEFPNPVNEVAARLVAGGVVALSVLTIVSQQHWLLFVLAYGFVARVVSGPALSPLARFVTGVVVPRLRIAPRYVAGPPKRFAQGIGATLSIGAVIAYFGLGSTLAADVLLALIAIAATLESVFGLCIGCKAFALLIRFGVVPEEICERCNNIWSVSPHLEVPADLSPRHPPRA